MKNTMQFAAAVVVVLALASLPAAGQVGSGLLDLNTATDAQLAGLPNVTPALVKDILATRPFGTIVEFNTFVTGKGLSAQQASAIYEKAFIHINLNTGTAEEILLIPRVGKRMTREFEEYRPWKTWAQFDKEISKYVQQPETDRLKQYVFIPVRLNTATDADILSIPGAGPRMLREFKEYRPWKTKAQFEKEIGKYVKPAEVARLWRYVVID
jgi:DNA uptake protein ComE-like DNA-binding protein